ADRQRERDAVDERVVVRLAPQPTWNQAEHAYPRPSGITKSSSIGGSFSCAPQPVAAKQRIRTSAGLTSSRRKCLKSGGSTQVANSERYLWKVCPLGSRPTKEPRTFVLSSGSADPPRVGVLSTR